MAGWLIDDVEVGGVAGQAVLVRGDRIVAIGAAREIRAGATAGTERLDGQGGALLPGLHDHHVHLLATAARSASVWCGPPEVASPADLIDRLRRQVRLQFGDRMADDRRWPSPWIRAVGWDDTEAGWPDRWVLDRAAGEIPVRLQHRSGGMWVLNSRGLELVGLGGPGPFPPGVEVGADDQPTGRLMGLDGWLRSRVGDEVPDLEDLLARLVRWGVTGVTDATPHPGTTELATLAMAHRRAGLGPRLVAMAATSEIAYPEGVVPGPVKLRIEESDLPSLDALAAEITAAHRVGRAVAIHAASRIAVVLAVGAMIQAGSVAGDRLEHASVTPPEMLTPLASLGLTVVTQPHFIAENGDRYLRSVPEPDLAHLYRGRSFVDAGVRLAAGTDAPIGGLNPWAAMAAAVARTTAQGVVMGEDERLSPEQALNLFTGAAHSPGGPAPVVAAGEPADLCLLDRPWAAARRTLGDLEVVATMIGGRMVGDRAIG